jgi:nucleoside-diphosphate-sugar epimerase
LTDYYDPEIKVANLQTLMKSNNFSPWTEDLLTVNMESLLDGVEVVFHLAGQPGVRDSWDTEFPTYVQRNVVATHRLLDALRERSVRRFVYSSSSSIYGDALAHPTTESALPSPRSPYGVTKLAAEHICSVYAKSWGVQTVSLRYFTVFGGGQRPDMAFHRLINCGLRGETFRVYGNGEQRRDFTHVDDVVRANISVAHGSLTDAGTYFNIAGGQSASLNEAIEMVGGLLGRSVSTTRLPAAAGDVRVTSADTSMAKHTFGWTPEVRLLDGLNEQVEWQANAFRLHV